MESTGTFRACLLGRGALKDHAPSPDISIAAACSLAGADGRAVGDDVALHSLFEHLVHEAESLAILLLPIS